jgi:hypothetical protein
MYQHPINAGGSAEVSAIAPPDCPGIFLPGFHKGAIFLVSLPLLQIAGSFMNYVFHLKHN